MKYKTTNHTFLDFLNNDEFVIGIGSIQKIVSNKRLFQGMLDLCHFCISEKELYEIRDFIKKHNIPEDILSIALTNNFIAHYHIDFQDKYSRNHLYYSVLGYDIEKVQEKISNSHILVIGAGGIGNIVSYFSSVIGVKKITIIDDDIVERSNLNRQFLFREKDIHSYKVDVIKRELSKLRNDSDVFVIKEKLNKKIIYDLDNIDLVICSADDDYCVELINEYCCIKKIPLINVGYLNDISVIGPFYIPKLPNSCCLCCDKSIYLENNIKNEKVNDLKANMKAPSTVVNNFFSGAMLGSEMIKLFAEDYDAITSLNAVIGIHNKDFQLEKIDLVKNENCQFCGGDVYE